MTTHALGARDYIDADVFAREERRIFRNLWILAGIRTMLDWPEAFITRTIGGVPVLIQNGGGRLRAFENQCAHRQMPIQFEPHGTRRMVCRYHGWVYGDDGRVRSMPDEDTLYRYSPERRAALGLREFALAEVGNLVFVNLSPDPMPIERQFHAAHLERMRAMSQQFSATCVRTSFLVRYNWKLNFENIVDGNHIPYLHPRTFAPLVVFGSPGGAGPASPPPAVAVAPRGEGAPSLRDATVNVDSPYQLKPWPWQDMVEGFETPDKFYDFNIYPNVNFYAPGGKFFVIQQFEPVAPDLTRYHLTLMTARETRRIPGLHAILWGYAKAEKLVLDEDIVALEKLQSALHAESAPPCHGHYEAPLRNLASVYRELMGDA